MEREVQLLYRELLIKGYKVTRCEITNSGVVIGTRPTKSSWPSEHLLRMYDEITAECSQCNESFKAFAARGVSKKLGRTSFGICEYCEIKNFIG